MNLSQALGRIRRKLGKKAAIQDTKKPSSPEQRAADLAARKAAADRKDKARAAMEQRRAAILNADAEYQQLVRDYDFAYREHKALPFPFYRYVGGTNEEIFFRVAAEADTLAELVAKIEAKSP